MIIFTVWTHDDGILASFDTLKNADEFIAKGVEEGWLDPEDVQIHQGTISQ